MPREHNCGVPVPPASANPSSVLKAKWPYSPLTGRRARHHAFLAPRAPRPSMSCCSEANNATRIQLFHVCAAHVESSPDLPKSPGTYHVGRKGAQFTLRIHIYIYIYILYHITPKNKQTRKKGTTLLKKKHQRACRGLRSCVLDLRDHDHQVSEVLKDDAADAPRPSASGGRWVTKRAMWQ